MQKQLLTLALAAIATMTIGDSWKPDTDRESKELIDHISAQSLKGHLSFIASDLLEGRNTPSRGLDIAAEYIAAQFRRAGLEPGGDNGYFQMATYPDLRTQEPVKTQNVIGVLRGSDPKLKNTYVMVTAHYDHLGIRQGGTGHNIYNGADDDGSGTVSVIELAAAFGHLKVHPKRSIIFMTFYGEEKGLVGSRFYGAHPAFPVADTVADVNLEQIGRTDDLEGPRVKEASMTGYDYNDLGTIFSNAGKVVGIKVTKHPRYSDAYFSRSDNQAMSDLGVPANTLCTAFDFPDYHQTGDLWPKVDYENMAGIDRMVALGLYTIANSTDVPHWNAQNKRAQRYLEKWRAMHPKG